MTSAVLSIFTLAYLVLAVIAGMHGLYGMALTFAAIANVWCAASHVVLRCGRRD